MLRDGIWVIHRLRAYSGTGNGTCVPSPLFWYETRVGKGEGFTAGRTLAWGCWVVESRFRGAVVRSSLVANIRMPMRRPLGLELSPRISRRA